MTSSLKIAALICACVITLSVMSMAGVPQLINYQGRLTDGVGNPLTETVTLTFTIYADSLGASTLWTEAHPSVVVTNGLFQVILGSVATLPQNVFDGNTRWLSVRVGAGASSALMPLVSTAYAYRSNVSDTAAIAKTVSDNAITSAKIQNGTISFADIGQNSAANGEVMKWNGSAWEAQTDATSANASGWTDGGTVVNLTTASDTVALNTSLRLGKLNIGGNVGMASQSSIFWGSDSAFIKGYSGGDMTLQGEDIFAQTRGSVYFADAGGGNFVEIDNNNKRVSIGTTTADERLHVENDASGGTCWLKIQGSHETNWGQTGLKIQTPANTWSLREDLYSHVNFPEGALSLYSSGGSKEAMTWLESGDVGVGTTNPLRKLHVNGGAIIADSLGIGTTSPTKKLHVYGSAMIKDTLYAGAIDPSLMSAAHLPDEPGVATKVSDVTLDLTDSWAPIDSLSISVPAAGYVLAVSSTLLSSDHTWLDVTDASVGLSASRNSGGNTIPWYLPAEFYSVTYWTTLSLNRVFRVDSPGTYWFYTTGNREVGSGQDKVTARKNEMSLLFVPTAYGSAPSKDTDLSDDAKWMTAAARPANTDIAQSAASNYGEELRALRKEVELLKKKLEEVGK